MNITVKKLAELHKPTHNIRRHSDKQITEYIRSIEMFGQVKPLVVAEDGEIIAGNGLYEALLRMGRETCDCYVMVGLTDVQKKKLMMADNKVYELGFTDVDAIEELVKELDGDVDVPGWDADLLEMLNSTTDEADEVIGSYVAISRKTRSHPSTAIRQRNTFRMPKHRPTRWLPPHSLLLPSPLPRSSLPQCWRCLHLPNRKPLLQRRTVARSSTGASVARSVVN